MQPKVSPCPEREKIMERYRAAIKTYHDATRSLEGLSGAEFEPAHLRVEQARQAFELVRKELGDHMNQHSCHDPSGRSLVHYQGDQLADQYAEDDEDDQLSVDHLKNWLLITSAV
jgi:hypothetical protein